MILKIDNIDVEAAINNVRALLKTDKSVSSALAPALKAALDMLLLLVTLLINQKGLNNKNSNIPPYSDPNRKKVSKAKSARWSDGQKGSKGTNLSKVDNPWINFKAAGYETRQEIDVTISRFVTEYRTEVLEDSKGHRFTATFPEAACSVRKQHQGTLGPHAKRGREAMNMFGVIPSFQGVLCHDHWQPYYLYDCLHSLCNAHYLRELERAFEQDQQQWAKAMQTCLLDINAAVDDSGGILNVKTQGIGENTIGNCLQTQSMNAHRQCQRRTNAGGLNVQRLETCLSGW
jgi:hypothetical protein